MDRPHASFDAVIHPYRSLGPRGFRLFIGFLIAINGVFAAVMISQGAWPVAGFLGLDVLAVYWAFQLSYAQARAFERFVIDGETLLVERVDKDGARKEWTFPAYWVSVWVEEDEVETTVTLRSHGRSLEVGAYLAPFERKDFAAALRKALAAAKAGPSALSEPPAATA
jgi:uncharacterized membrane protein